MKYINGTWYKKTETHMHVSPWSVCSHMDARTAAEKYAKCGFEAVIVTNHYSRPYLDRYALSEEEYREHYIAGYRTFRDIAKEYGIEVFLGAEVTLFAHYSEKYRREYPDEVVFENFADYLIYGVTEEFIRSTPFLCDLTLPKLSEICHAHGAVLVQAHPYRTEQLHSLKDIKFLDGIEMNGNEDFPSGPHEADCLRLAREHGLIATCGGDTHCPWTHLRNAMYIPAEIHDSVAFANYLKEVPCNLRLDLSLLGSNRLNPRL